MTVGDGDFTFSLSLSNWFCFKSQSIDLTVTSYQSKDEMLEMYHKSSMKTHQDLLKNGAKIFYSIDATKLNFDENFDLIVWNFPHAGFPE